MEVMCGSNAPTPHVIATDMSPLSPYDLDENGPVSAATNRFLKPLKVRMRDLLQSVREETVSCVQLREKIRVREDEAQKRMLVRPPATSYGRTVSDQIHTDLL